MANAGNLTVTLGLDAAQYTQGLDKAAAAQQKFEQQQARATASINKQIAALRTQAQTIGFTVEQAKIFSLRKQGASDEQLLTAVNLLKQNKVYEEANKAAEAARQKARAVAEASAAIDKQVGSLQTQAAVLGKSTRETALFKLQQDGANKSQLASADAALKQTAAFERSVAVTNKLKVALPLVFLAGAAAIAKNIKALDDLDEAAQGLGVTTVALAEMQKAASDAGVGSEKLQMALTNLNVKIDEARSGNVEAIALFEALGISLEDISKLTTEQFLARIADQIKVLGNDSAKGALLVETLGKKVGPDLAAYLNQGSGGLRKYAGVSEQTIEANRRLNDEIDRFKGRISAQTNAIVGEVAIMSNSLTELIEKAKELGDSLKLRDLGLIGQAANFLRGGSRQTNDQAIDRFATGGTDLRRYDIEQEARGSAQAILDHKNALVAEDKALKDIQAIIDEDERSRVRRTRVVKDATDVQRTYADQVEREARLAKLSESDRRGVYEIELLTKGYQDATEAARRLNEQVDQITGRSRLAEQDRLLQELNKRYNENRISLQEYQVGYDYVFGTEGVKKLEETNSAAEELGLTFSSALEDAIIDFSSLRDVLKGLEKDLLRIGTRKLVTEPLANWATELFKGIGSGGSGGGFGSILGALFGGGGQNLSGVFASGTDFVPRDGLAYLHRGEKVIDAATNRKGGGGMVTNMTFVLPPGGVSRETQNQIAQRAGQAIRQAQRIS